MQTWRWSETRGPEEGPLRDQLAVLLGRHLSEKRVDAPIGFLCHAWDGIDRIEELVLLRRVGDVCVDQQAVRKVSTRVSKERRKPGGKAATTLKCATEAKPIEDKP